MAPVIRPPTAPTAAASDADVDRFDSMIDMELPSLDEAQSIVPQRANSAAAAVPPLEPEPDLEPLAIDHFDSGTLMLEAAAQGLGVAFMLETHFEAARDPRLVQLFDLTVESHYSYWFVCRPRALTTRPVRIFHDWLIGALGAAE